MLISGATQPFPRVAARRNAAGALIPIFDPFTSRANPANPAQTIRDPFPGNVIPQGRLDPTGARIAALYPLPNRAAANLAGANNFTRNASMGLDITTATTKIDHNFSERDRLSARIIVHDFPTFTNPVFDEPAAGCRSSCGARCSASFRQR